MASGKTLPAKQICTVVSAGFLCAGFVSMLPLALETMLWAFFALCVLVLSTLLLLRFKFLSEYVFSAVGLMIIAAFWFLLTRNINGGPRVIQPAAGIFTFFSTVTLSLCISLHGNLRDRRKNFYSTMCAANVVTLFFGATVTYIVLDVRALHATNARTHFELEVSDGKIDPLNVFSGGYEFRCTYVNKKADCRLK